MKLTVIASPYTILHTKYYDNCNTKIFLLFEVEIPHFIPINRDSIRNDNSFLVRGGLELEVRRCEPPTLTL